MRSRDFVDWIKVRSYRVDMNILRSMLDGDNNPVAITLTEIYELPYPRSIITNRLKVLNGHNAVDVNKDEVKPGNTFRLYLSSSEIFPLNADDLGLSPRDKLIVSAINDLQVATISQIHQELYEKGDSITREYLRQQLRRLRKMALVKNFKQKGVREKFYKLRDDINHVFIPDREEDLLNECLTAYRFSKAYMEG